jgi:peptide-methionine (R)-S-oxide reductase
MNRRQLCAGIGVASLAAFGSRLTVAQGDAGAGDVAVTPLKKTRDQWSKLLEPERYDVLFSEDTEYPGTSLLNKEKRRGTYICAACFLPLFKSEHKFESGTGWPSFTQPIEGRIGKRTDRRLIIARTEYHCARCGGHQGHVFEDGPPPRGERWCNNGLALEFVPDGEALPSLRN